MPLSQAEERQADVGAATAVMVRCSESITGQSAGGSSRYSSARRWTEPRGFSAAALGARVPSSAARMAQALPAELVSLAAAMSDAEPCVRVAALEAVGRGCERTGGGLAPWVVGAAVVAAGRVRGALVEATAGGAGNGRGEGMRRWGRAARRYGDAIDEALEGSGQLNDGADRTGAVWEGSGRGDDGGAAAERAAAAAVAFGSEAAARRYAREAARSARAGTRTTAAVCADPALWTWVRVTGSHAQALPSAELAVEEAVDRLGGATDAGDAEAAAACRRLCRWARLCGAGAGAWPAPGETEVLVRALPAAARCGLRAVVSLVASRTRDEDSAVRAAACACLGALGAPALLLLPTGGVVLARRLIAARGRVGASGGGAGGGASPAFRPVLRPAGGGSVSDRAIREAMLVLGGASDACAGAAGREGRALCCAEAEAIGAEESASVRAAAAQASVAMAASQAGPAKPGREADVTVSARLRNALTAALWLGLLRGHCPRREGAAALAGMGGANAPDGCSGVDALEAAALSSLRCGIAKGLPDALCPGGSRRWRVSEQAQVAAVRALSLLPLPDDEPDAWASPAASMASTASVDKDTAWRWEDEAEARGDSAAATGSRCAAAIGAAERAARVLWQVVGAASAARDDAGRGAESWRQPLAAPIVAAEAARALARLAHRARRRRLRWPGGGLVSLCDAVPRLRIAAMVRGLTRAVVACGDGAVRDAAAGALAELGAEGELALTELALSGVKAGGRLTGAVSSAACGAAAEALGLCEGRPATTLLLLASGAGSSSGRSAEEGALAGLRATGAAAIVSACEKLDPSKRTRLAGLAQQAAERNADEASTARLCSAIARGLLLQG